ncbi:uncharacterized protein LOC111904596 [Lactuca sativa]|uniref:uncharacterized protein LOC111904596 n=1 Tax=Lactuca sativa TaxID=4236 RepID=UPI000CD99C40|nr:uncharacterized protein LOC111904596 [Lactuca sativa]
MKVTDATFVKDFRRITLIGCQYKIIGKILSNRISSVIGDLVSAERSAFVVGHQILDGPFIVSEVISWCKTKKKKAMVFKVVFEKAYGSVRWDFLDDILVHFGFGSGLHKWIQAFLTSSIGFVLVNGSLKEEV